MENLSKWSSQLFEDQQIEYMRRLMQWSGGGALGAQLGQSGHYSAVKKFRREFKQYTKTEFRELSNKPMIKDILSGMTKLNQDQIKDRIKEHLDQI